MKCDCKICNRKFTNITKLVSHLSHPKSTCKISIKSYYDQYYKKENEGICQFCGRSTSFSGLVKGYPNNTCKYCRNLKPESKIKRKTNTLIKKEIKKNNNGYYQLPIKCELCQDNIRFKNLNGLSKHIVQIHKINTQEYYNNFLKKEGEDICSITGENTNFKNLTDGYYTYYGKGTSSADPKIKNKKKKTLLKNYNVSNAVEVNKEIRLRNFKNTLDKKKLLKEKRNELLIILRKLTINKQNKLQCQICGRIFFLYSSISSHIKKGHKIEIQKYYDDYFKKENEDICLISNLKTNFDCLQRGYFKYHNSMISYTPEIKEGNKKWRLEYIKNKIIKEQSKYNVKIVNINDIKYIGDLILFECNKCKNQYETRFTNLVNGYGKCKKCYPHNTHKSIGENELSKFIHINYLGTILTSYKDLIRNPLSNQKLELDIFIPDKRIAIEFNGLYWHSECILDNPQKYHLIKTQECKKNKIQLIHIFEDEWYNKKEIIKSMLLHKFEISNKPKLYARNCYVKIIDSSIKNHFLNINHIQGGDTSRIKLGLFIKEIDVLVAVMTFSGRNLSRGTINLKDTDWELSRFATNLEYRVIGAAGKLLSYFKRNFEWTLIFSYADLRYSVGNLYYQLGFKKISQSFPNYWYVNNQGKRYHRFSLRKRPDEPKEIPEWKLRREQGYYRIWDCGHLKFSIINN